MPSSRTWSPCAGPFEEFRHVFYEALQTGFVFREQYFLALDALFYHFAQAGPDAAYAFIIRSSPRSHRIWRGSITTAFGSIMTRSAEPVSAISFKSQSVIMYAGASTSFAFLFTEAGGDGFKGVNAAFIKAVCRR